MAKSRATRASKRASQVKSAKPAKPRTRTKSPPNSAAPQSNQSSASRASKQSNAPDQVIARHITRLKAEPAAEENVAQLQADIQQHGLDAFYDALAQTPEARRLARQKPPAAPTKGLFAPAPPGDVGQIRQTWQNYDGSLSAQPLRLFKPTTLAELRSIIQQAAAHKARVKAVGSGHSFTDVAVGADFVVDTHGLGSTLPLEQDVLKAGVDTSALFETEGGITVRDLNEALWDAGLGLLNMGGYDGQTIMGVVSTSTHGTGIEFGPLSGFALSLTLMLADGRVLRMEPHDGITDPAKWTAKHPDVELVQDDDRFNAVQVGIGCMGVVCSLVLQVRERYWMKEQRTLSTWAQVKQDILAGQVLAENRHYEVLVNPYLTNNQHTCLITRRNPVPEPAVPPDQLPTRNVLIELFARFPGSGQLLLGLLNTAPDLTPTLIDAAMQGLARDYVDRSYRVFNIGAANDAPAYGSEIGFPLRTCTGAVERILQIAAGTQSVGKAYLTSPFSLRFVKASPAFLSMMHGADTCMIEFPMLDNTVGGKELLRRIEHEMYAFGGRPHWGLLNFVAGADLVAAMYPQFGKWLDVRRQLDPNGVFDNAFTDRAGISAQRTFVRS
jgi:L-gulono-1,4-lactone dehydrogenase